VIIDRSLNPIGSEHAVAFGNLDGYTPPGPVTERAGGTVQIQELDGTTTPGPAQVLAVSLRPMEIHILIPA
jgi:hypothetical protein